MDEVEGTRALRRSGADRGASVVEYAGLIALAVVILGGLYAVGIHTRVASGVGTALCKILQQDDCGKKPVAAGDSPDPGSSPQSAVPRATDPLQVRAASVTAKAGQPQPNPSPQRPPPQQAGGPVQTPWGPSYGYGPGNPGIGDSGDLPTGGDNPYVPPKSGRGKPVKIKGKKAWKDAKGRTWEWDKLHKDHWDVTDKNGDHINVNPDGSEARKPNATASPSASPSAPKGKGKSHFDWKPWGIGAGAAGAGGLLWWGGKLLSPACGPFAPACAIVL